MPLRWARIILIVILFSSSLGCAFNFSNFNFASGGAPLADELPATESSLFEDGPVDLPVTVAKLDAPVASLIIITISEIGGNGDEISELEDGAYYEFTFTGLAGAVADPTATPYVLLQNVVTGDQVIVGVAGDGSFELSIAAAAEQDIVLMAITTPDAQTAQGSSPLIYHADTSGTVSFATTNTSYLVTDQNLTVDEGGNSYFSTLETDGTYTLWRQTLSGGNQEIIVSGIEQPVTLIALLSETTLTYATADGAMYFVSDANGSSASLESRFLSRSDGAPPQASVSGATSFWTQEELPPLENSSALELKTQYKVISSSRSDFLIQRAPSNLSNDVEDLVDMLRVTGSTKAAVSIVSKLEYEKSWIAKGNAATAYLFTRDHGSLTYSLFELDLSDISSPDGNLRRPPSSLLADDIALDIVSVNASTNGILVIAGTDDKGHSGIYLWSPKSGLKNIIDLTASGENYELYPKISPNGEFVITCDQGVTPPQFIAHRTGIGLSEGRGDPEGVFVPLTTSNDTTPCPVQNAFIDGHYVIQFYQSSGTGDDLAYPPQLATLFSEKHKALKNFIVTHGATSEEQTGSGQVADSIPANDSGSGSGDTNLQPKNPSGATGDFPVQEAPVAPVNATAPDLAAQNVNVVGNVAGTAVRFSGLVKNRGTATALASHAQFYLDADDNGTWDQDLGVVNLLPLGPDATSVVDVPDWIAVIGNHRVKFCVDSGAALAEADETNNCLSRAFTIVPAEPDLASKNLVIGAGNAGSSVTFTGNATNTGTAATTITTKSRFRLDLGNNGSWDVILGIRDVPPLAPTAANGVGSNNWTAVAGTHKIQLCADYSDQLVESSELNNCQVQVFTITP